MSILFSILGIAYLLIFAYEYQQKYFEFTDDKIKLYTIPKKEIKINEITEAKYFAEDYVFKTPNQSLTIVKSQLNKKQLPEFESFFNGLKDTLKK
ncbi:hypothetical protein ACF3NR_09700 [Vaginella massiliensis]|uniref:hypothetical protein n=1 Tax=Vaginella massiliensis TaxID=1816680 RepID=UPI0012B5E4BF|nr:hypothetical protein [Vaginella massiliensis]